MLPRVAAASGYIGFGSFHFQVTEKAPEDFSGADYLSWIEEVLRCVPAATVIDVSTFEQSYLDAVWSSPLEYESYADAAISYPPLEFCRIKFAVEIPLEDQGELLGEAQQPWDHTAERFLVSIRDGWQMPTALVWPIEAASPREASTAVQVVREYLRREVGSGQDQPIRFDCIGPSPAHFTVELSPSPTSQEEAFQLVGRDRSPYPNYRYTYHAEFDPPSVAVEEFHFEALGQLDLLYRIEAARISQGMTWDRAETGARNILSAYEERGPRAAVRRFAQGRHLRRVLVALVEVELNQNLNHRRLTTEFAGEYDEPPDVNLQQVVEDQLDGFEIIPIEPLSKLLEALDAGRQTGRAVVIAAIASLIGAVVAAVATLIAS